MGIDANIVTKLLQSDSGAWSNQLLIADDERLPFVTVCSSYFNTLSRLCNSGSVVDFANDLEVSVRL